LRLIVNSLCEENAASGAPAPGEENAASGAPAPGEENAASGAPAPGEENAASGAPAPGEENAWHGFFLIAFFLAFSAALTASNPWRTAESTEKSTVTHKFRRRFQR
jgi:hypothetical protein